MLPHFASSIVTAVTFPSSEARGVSPPGRPKGEHRSAEHEGSTVSPPGRPKGEHRSAEHEGTPVSTRPDLPWPVASARPRRRHALRRHPCHRDCRRADRLEPDAINADGGGLLDVRVVREMDCGARRRPIQAMGPRNPVRSADHAVERGGPPAPPRATRADVVHVRKKKRAALEADAARQSCRSQEERRATARTERSHGHVAASRHGARAAERLPRAAVIVLLRPIHNAVAMAP